MCRFNECTGFMWSSCHAGVVRLLLDTCAEILTILPTSSKHVSVGMRFLGRGIGGLSHQSCMYLHIGTNNIVGGSITGLDPVANTKQATPGSSPVPQISAFSLRRKCGWEYSDRNAEKSPHSYMGKNAEKMRMGAFGQERGEISAFLYGKKCGGNA